MGGWGTVKGRLALLAAGLVAASLLAAAWLVADAHRRAGATFERQLQDTARALSMAIDRQLGQAAAFNAALAIADSLARGDLDAFDAQARRALGDQPAWIVLSDRTGQQLVNTLKPRGTPLPRDSAGMDALWPQLEAGSTVVGDLIPGAVAGRPVLVVDTPVFVDGRLAYDLSYAFEPEVVRRLLLEQRLPDGWVAVVVDGAFRVVARTRGGQDMVGRPATQAFAAAVRAAGEGTLRTVSLDGEEVVTAFRRIDAGWSIAVVVPASELSADVYRSIALGGAGALLIIAIGTIGAARVAASISGPVTRLADLAGRLGVDGPLTFHRTGMAEADAVGTTLACASRRLDERERALAIAEERQRLAFQAAGIGTWDVDVATGRRVWSPEYRAILGIAAAAAADPAAFAALIHPEDRPRVVETYERLYRPDHPDRYVAEFRILRADDGVERWVRTEGRLIRDAEGRPARAIGVLADVTEQHQDRAALAVAMERLRVAVASVPFPLMLEAEGGVILEASRAWWEMSRRPADAASTTADWAAATLGAPAVADPARGPFGYAVPVGEAHLGAGADERIWDFRVVPLDPTGDGRALRLVAAVDVTERERAARRQDLLVAELNHRVKNTLATVQAIATRTAATTPDKAVFVEKFTARLEALARTHVVLTEHGWGRVQLRDLLVAELSPYAATGAVTLSGPDVDVAAETAVSLCLLFHELATNAVKHGSLADADGRLRVSWTRREGGRGGFDAVWAESCPHPPAPPTTEGFGTRLVAATLRGLGGGSVTYGPEGVTCRIAVDG